MSWMTPKSGFGKLIFPVILLSILLLAFASAFEAHLESSATELTAGETLRVDLTINNPSPEEITEYFDITTIETDGAVILSRSHVSVPANSSVTKTIFSRSVLESDMVGTGLVRLAFDSGMVLSKNYSFFGVKKRLSASLDLCVDGSCGVSGAVIGDQLDVIVKKPSDADYQIMVVLPDGSERTISQTRFELEEIGSYDVKAVIFGEHYNSLFLHSQLLVKARPSIVGHLDICVLDGICSGKETPDNCPADCMEDPFVDEVSEKGADIDDSGSGHMIDRPQNFTGKSKLVIPEDGSGESPLLKTFLILGFMAALLLLLMVIISHHKSEGG